MSVPKKYTSADIQRYHSGQLSPAERHALEKAALDDPFLADALEGYAVAQTPSADLSALQQRLKLRVEKEKKRRSILYLNNWMKVAALLLLMAGGGWLVLQLSSKKEEIVAAKESPGQATPETQRLPDSAGVSSSAPLIVERETNEQEKKERYASNRSKVAMHKAPAKKPVDIPDASKILRTDSTTSEGYVGSIASTQGRLNEVVVSQNPTDNFAKKQRNASALADTVRNVNVTLKPTELPADETVVLNRTTDRPQTKRMYVALDSLEPAEGWSYFDDYITSNLHEPEEVKTKGINGEVELQFEVDKEGQPVNITVTHSLCDKCDEEAIRLLKDGPKWKKNKKKGKVKIKFTPTR